MCSMTENDFVTAKTCAELDVKPSCFQTCSPGETADHFISQSLANYTMNACMDPSMPNDVEISASVTCEGPQKKLFRAVSCGVKVAVSITATTEQHPE